MASGTDTVDALAYARKNQTIFLERLFELLRIPSISTLAENVADIDRAADWLVSYLTETGLSNAQKYQTAGHPLVYAEWLEAGSSAPVLLIYGHYDVQPVDPLDLWHTPPFEPVVKGDHLYCRGASDDKGQMMALLFALESYLKASGRLPLNVKVLLEGEEEILSPNMDAFLAAHREQLACDAIVICDDSIFDANTPVITYGLRGNCYMEIEVSGPSQDLHSGSFGGAVDNPLNVLVRMLAALQDSNTHRVLIPGFYEHVREIDEAERALLTAYPGGEEQTQLLTGVPALAGESGYSAIERTSVRPTLDIHGIPGGFTAKGKKTVIPAHVGAKISMRLVPDQDPDEIQSLFEKYLRSIAPPTVHLEFRCLGKALPAVVDYRHPAVQAAAEAYQRGFGAFPVYTRTGGSIAVVAEMIHWLGAPVVMAGLGLPDDQIHAPNERFYLPNFYRGIETMIHYYDILAAGRMP
ncbi:MAG: dipeptidase [Anaerolineaceae bacterium]|nr:dipeptidase [Anaerolineaceae bacterium]